MPFIGLFFVFCISSTLILISFLVRAIVHPGVSKVSSSFVGLTFIGAFVALIAPGFVVANLSLWLLAPIRRILDANAKEAKGLSLRVGIGGLLKVGLITVPVGLVLLIIWVA